MGILVLVAMALAVAVAHSLSSPKDNKDYKGEYTALICNICLALGFLIGYDAAKKTNNDDKIETNSGTKMLIINDSIVVPIQPMSSRIIVLDTNEE